MPVSHIVWRSNIMFANSNLEIADPCAIAHADVTRRIACLTRQKCGMVYSCFQNSGRRQIESPCPYLALLLMCKPDPKMTER